MQSRESFQDLVASLDTSEPVALRDWSAQQFSLMYVRFRPLLVEHAKRFVGNEQLAEEITQDAFLYLMTSLPELDSELGVLRFLKWKTKMLCMDVTRGRATKGGSHLELNEDFLIDTSEPVDQLERADDAAVVQLALAKLSPRHREVLVKTIFEEKSHDEVAFQMGLSTNALRQLIYRARHSFKVALVGEAEVAGKSVTEILAIAAGRSLTSKIAPSIAVILVLSLGFIALVGSWKSPVDAPYLAKASSVRDARYLIPAAPSPVPEPLEVFNTNETIGDLRTVASIGVDNAVQKSSLATAPLVEDASYSQNEGAIAVERFNSSLGTEMVAGLAAAEMKPNFDGEIVIADNELGLVASFAIDLETENVVQFLLLSYSDGHSSWKAVPQNSLTVSQRLQEDLIISYVATDFLVGDFSGLFDYVSSQDSVLSRSGIELVLEVDPSGEVRDVKVSMISRG